MSNSSILSNRDSRRKVKRTKSNEPRPLCILLHKRVIFVVLGFFGYCLMYSHKVFLSVTLVAMMNQTSNGKSEISSECGVNATISESFQYEQKISSSGKFNWTSDQKALLLGAFFYGYCLLQLPAALLAQRIGSKWVFGVCILFASLLSFLGPVLVEYSYLWLFAIRFCQGLADGVVAPVVYSMIAKWIPKMERSVCSTTIFMGSQIGTVVTSVVAGELCKGTFLGGWPAVFYLIGVTGCVWFVLWAVFVHESPESHPHITLYELGLIKHGQMGEEASSTTFAQIPWKSIFTSIPFYALMITHFGQNWGFLTLLTTLPLYFEEIFDFSIEKNGLMSSMPYLLQALCGWLAGILSDRARKSGRVSINIIRKFNNTLSYIGPAICLIAVVQSRCDSVATIAFFSLAMALNGPSYSGYRVTHVDMAPEFAGVLMGITNSIANIPGFLGPVVVSAFTKNGKTLENWSHVFYTTSAVYVITALIYIIFSTSELQSWGVVKRGNNGDQNRNKIINNSDHSLSAANKNNNNITNANGVNDLEIDNKGFEP